MPHAIVVRETGGPDVLRYEPCAAPEPGPGQVRVAVHAAGVNFIDVYFRTGLYPGRFPTWRGSRAPASSRRVGRGRLAPARRPRGLGLAARLVRDARRRASPRSSSACPTASRSTWPRPRCSRA